MRCSYWVPSLYHVSGDGKFSLLNVTNVNVYYDLYVESEVVPFPDDFQMVIGDAMNIDGNCSDANGEVIGHG